MKRMHRNLLRLVAGLVLAGSSGAALAGIDTFIVVHRSGPCGDFKFPTNTSVWSTFKSNGSRIPIATNETVVVTLYGRFANSATDATGSDIFEWIDAKGTNSQGKDYVKVAARAESQHGTGNRTVTVKWPSYMVPGQETIPFKVVSSCENLRGLGFRIAPTPPSEQPTSTVPRPPTNPPLIYCTEDPVPGNDDPCG
ncbi:MAG: hypothetical protein NDI84_04115 [Steroidobacteraceae bacterium]|nr:hypothetical protein [Steroidobacteraceae bacterium]